MVQTKFRRDGDKIAEMLFAEFFDTAISSRRIPQSKLLGHPLTFGDKTQNLIFAIRLTILYQLRRNFKGSRPADIGTHGVF